MKPKVSWKYAVRGLAAAALLTAAFGATTACVASLGGGAYVAFAPPAPIVEARVMAPGPGFVWVSGFYQWNGGGYMWVPGRWERPPRPYARWVPGRWEQRGNRGWRFREGHWREHER